MRKNLRMQKIKKLIKLLGIFVGVFLLYCLFAIAFFDKKCHDEQSLLINANNATVWNHVKSLKDFNEWNPWLKYDPNLTITYSGNSGEIGDKYHWIGNEDVGEGEQEIVGIVPGKKVITKMKFIKPMDDEASSDLILLPNQNSTKVTWTIDYEIDNIFKPLKPFMTYQMNKSYREGLLKLKEICEK